MHKPTSNRPRGLQRQQGVGLIEVLISMLVIGVGFMNIAALQTVAKKSNYEALQRTSATILARDIVEKMRANPISLSRYLTAGVGDESLTQPAATCIAASKCNPLQIAAYDLWLWEQALDGASESRDIDGVTTETGGLVSPTGCITGPAAGGSGVYTISIVWRGLSELTNVSANVCGVASGLYGADEEFRRLLIITTYISP